MDLSNFVYWEKIDRNFLLLPTQSDPDSQTARPLARNTASGCNAARSLHRNTGFGVGKADGRSDRRAHPFSDDPRRCIRSTTRDCRPYRSSLSDADLVVVEIGEVLFAVFGVVKDLRQRFVAVLVGVDIGVAAFVGVLLQ